MQFWDTIINTAMLGTDKKQVSAIDVPSEIKDATTIILENQAKDKEEKFLQLASIASVFRQSGILPARKEIVQPSAPDEEKKYCGDAAIQALKDILAEESIPLLKFWLQYCNANQHIVTSELVPQLLTIASQHKKLQNLVSTCCGKTGEWLAGFNPDWSFSSVQTAEDIWQTGTFEQRKEVLTQTRKADSAKAREWVQSTWSQEDANTKTELLAILSENTNEDDIAFLESLANEKSKKVKEQALNILKTIPGSSIIKEYEEVIRQSVSIKKEKTMLGMSSKNVLQFQLPEQVPDSIFKSGIEKLSGQKNISDETFIFYQLIGFIPPVFWELHFSQTPGEIIALFNKSEEGKRMIPAIGMAVSRFEATNWIPYFLDDEKRYYSDLVPLLDKKTREQYILKFINVDVLKDSVINQVLKEEGEWGYELARAVLNHASRNPYQFNKNFFNQQIHLLPVQVVGDLERFTPADENLRTMWSNISEYIMKLVALKIQTIKAFNE